MALLVFPFGKRAERMGLLSFFGSAQVNFKMLQRKTFSIATTELRQLHPRSVPAVGDLHRVRQGFGCRFTISAVDKPRLQTFGASIDSISQFVFADTSISHQYQETLQTWLDSLGPGISIEAIIEQFGNQMNSETLSYVARLIRSRS
ncbi:hypothetical protein ABIF65_011697 [Bradyrhizobium japonicum]